MTERCGEFCDERHKTHLGAGRVVTSLRSRLDADITGMCQVLRSLLGAGVIGDLDELFLPVKESTGFGADGTPWVAMGCEGKEMEERGWI